MDYVINNSILFNSSINLVKLIMDSLMNGTIIKIKNIRLFLGISFGLFFLALLFSCSSMNSIMEPEGDEVAKPMITQIEKYKENSGHYPDSLMKLIPDYIPNYDFQTFIYKRNKAQGDKLEEYVKKGLIIAGQGEGYVLKVRFQRYKAECTYINGKRQSCRYIGHF